MVLVRFIQACRSQAFKDNNDLDIVALPQGHQGLFYFVLDHHIQIAMAILDTLQSVALLNLTEKEISVDRDAEASEG